MIAGSLIWIVLSLFIDNLASLQIYHGKSIIGKDYLSGIFIVPVILLAYLFYGMYVNFTAGIYIQEKTKVFPLITGIGALVNVGVNILLIPLLGIFGAALATLVSYIFMSAGLYFYSQKYYKINYEFYKVISILFLLISASVIYYYLYFSNSLNLISKVLVLIVFISLFFFMKIIKKEEVIKTIKLLVRRKS